MDVVGIVAAGGQGARLGGPLPKQLRDLGGRSVLQRTVDAFDRSGRVQALIVVLPADWIDHPAATIESAKPLERVVGGERRQESVARGFDRVPLDAEVVVVHDAARPFVTPALIDRTVDAARESGAAIAALSVQETVKEATDRVLEADESAEELPHDVGARRWVKRTLPRGSIVLAQTPQAFRRAVLEAAVRLGRQGVEATDEATLAELAGYPVRLVEGDPRNLKITTPADLDYARWLVGRPASEGPLRVGVGYDVHRLVPGRPLVLGGVAIPFDRGPVGHSDGDAVCHAIIDALLGAVAAGDIGAAFPDTDERWRGAISLELLRRIGAELSARGFQVANIDVVVILEQPRIAPYAAAMRHAIASALAIEGVRVSVKGKTHEGLGPIGQGEAVAAHAVALVAGPV